MSSNSVAALTSYAETLPAASASTTAKPGRPFRAPSILLSPISTKGRRTTKNLLHGTLRRTSDAPNEIVVFRTPDMSAPVAATPVHTRSSPQEISFETSDNRTPSHCDSPHETVSSGRLLRGRAALSASSNASCTRIARVDGDPLTLPSTVSDAAPFATFTSHLRQRLALCDAGIEVDGNSSTTNNEALTAVEIKPAVALPHLNSARGMGGGGAARQGEDDGAGVPQLLTPPRAPSTTTGCACGCSILRSVTAGDATVLGEKDLDAVSRELTTLLRSADAAVELLGRHQRILQPEQRRLLSHLQRNGAEPPLTAEWHHDVTRRQVTSVVDAAGPPPKWTAQSSGSLLRSPPQRIMIRPQRNITWE